MDLLLAFVLAMSVTMALVPLLTRFAARMQVLDSPGPRKVHANPIPRVGGLAMAAGACLPMLFWTHGDLRSPAYLAAAALLLAVGVWDDRVELGYLAKFAAQLVAAVLVVTWGGALIHSITLGERLELPTIVAVPLTVVFIVGVTNAINLADGLDGLAGGTTLLTCLALALLALTLDDRFVATVSIIVAGSILGFLRFNTYPARIFMGDGGSQLLGFTAAVLAVLVTQGNSATVSAALPVLLLGLPILDTISVMVHRLAEHRSPFEADKNHIHHRLLSLGFRHHEAVLVIYLGQAVLFLAAWYLRYESDLTILLVFAIYAAVVLGALQGATRSGWRWRPLPADAAGSASNRGPGWWRWLRTRLPAWSLTVSGLLAAAYCLRIAWLAAPIPADVGWLAAGLAVVLLLATLIKTSDSTSAWLPHGCLYVAAVVVVYLDVLVTPAVPDRSELPLLLLLATSVMLAFRLTARRRFRLTPLDFIVVFVVLALPNLPGSIASPRELGLGAVKVAVMFYAVELLMTESRLSRGALQGVVVAVMAMIGIRALL
jgi:UDP-GlcNAc:undecaprenyl-phosphate GlcNAc-1-phosphate transferase